MYLALIFWWSLLWHYCIGAIITCAGVSYQSIVYLFYHFNLKHFLRWKICLSSQWGKFMRQNTHLRSILVTGLWWRALLTINPAIYQVNSYSTYTPPVIRNDLWLILPSFPMMMMFLHWGLPLGHQYQVPHVRCLLRIIIVIMIFNVEQTKFQHSVLMTHDRSKYYYYVGMTHWTHLGLPAPNFQILPQLSTVQYPRKRKVSN